MPIRAGDIIRRASIVLNDEDMVRWPLAELIAWLNDGAAEVVVRRPAARAVIDTIELVEGCLQVLPEGCIELMDVVRNVGGRPIRRTDRQLLDDIDPNWTVMKPASVVKHFTFDERAGTSFHVYPPAKVGVQVQALFSQAPPPATDAESQIDLGREYIGPLVSYLLYRALAKDSEYANGALAAAHYSAFSEAVGVRNEVAGAVTPNVGSI